MADTPTAGNAGAASLIYVTCASIEEAREIAGAAVRERLAACANVIPGMRSIYWWDGAVQDDAEVVLILKTGANRVAALTERVRALHSYTVPCVVELPIARGNPDFIDWIAGETASDATTDATTDAGPAAAG